MSDDTTVRALRTRLEHGEATAALTKIRSPAARAAALSVLDHDLEAEVQIAAVRYLAELGPA